MRPSRWATSNQNTKSGSTASAAVRLILRKCLDARELSRMDSNHDKVIQSHFSGCSVLFREEPFFAGFLNPSGLNLLPVSDFSVRPHRMRIERRGASLYLLRSKVGIGKSRAILYHNALRRREKPLGPDRLKAVRSTRSHTNE